MGNHTKLTVDEGPGLPGNPRTLGLSRLCDLIHSRVWRNGHLRAIEKHVLTDRHSLYCDSCSLNIICHAVRHSEKSTGRRRRAPGQLPWSLLPAPLSGSKKHLWRDHPASAAFGLPILAQAGLTGNLNGILCSEPQVSGVFVVPQPNRDKE